MSDNYVNNPINLVHYHMLKHKSFEEIRTLLGLSESELIDNINKINCSNNQKTPIIYIDEKPKIAYQKREFTIHQLNNLKKKLKLMVVSDKHIDHLYDSFRYIDDVYEEAERRGINYIFDLGDILNGPITRVHDPKKVRTGTLEGSIEQLKKHHPSSIPTYFITGNHDLKFMESNACNIGKLIESECKNMVFLNNLFTCINIGNLRINLSHGSIEDKHLAHIKLNKEFKFLSTNNPHIICQGHFHISNCPVSDGPLLCQVPSLKFSRSNSYISKNSKGDEMGAVFLTIKELSDTFEIEQETVEFIQAKRLVKREISIGK